MIVQDVQITKIEVLNYKYDISGHFFFKVPLLGKHEKTPKRLCFGSVTQKSPYFYIVDDLRSQTYNILFFLVPKLVSEKNGNVQFFNIEP